MSTFAKAFNANWPLFLGILLVMIGNGLQGSLLGIRAGIEGFDTFIIGLLMSCYYLGFLGGYFVTGPLIIKVGHIRVFAALASMASTAVLVHGLFVNEVIWAIARLLSGFCYAGLYIVIESWLNKAATNKNRGAILSLYLVMSYGGLVLGQFMLNVAQPETMELFVMTSILVSIALLPVALSTRPAPILETPEPISLKRLYIISPMGVAGMFLNGVGAGIIFAIGPVFATMVGYSVAETSFFMAAMVGGGMSLPVIVGHVSDYINRRLVMIIVSAFIAFLCVIAALIPPTSSFYLLLLVAFLYGGFCFSIYGLAMAHTNDYLKPSQMVSASSSLILVNGLGSCIGPVMISSFMSGFGAYSFFIGIALIYALLFAFGIYRSFMREAISTDDQQDYVNMPDSATPVALQIAEEEVK